MVNLFLKVQSIQLHKYLCLQLILHVVTASNLLCTAHTAPGDSNKSIKQIISMKEKTNVFALISLFLQESGVPNAYFDDENLLKTVMNLFAAGTDTTGITLRWAFLYMAKYPKIQGRSFR